MVAEPSEFSLVVGINNAREVWNTLEQRFASTSRANILNMKIGLQNIEKGTDTINGFLQRIKAARDWLLAVGVTVDNEELICIVLRGLPKEYAQIFFFFFLLSRLEVNNSYEKILIENAEGNLHSMAMYSSSNQKQNVNHSQA